MTPLQIEMMLHFHLSPVPYPRRSAAAEDALQWFREEGLVQEPASMEKSVSLSNRGRAYVQFLIAMPLPAASWHLPGPWRPVLPDGPRGGGE